MKAPKMVGHRLKAFWKKAWWSKIILAIICMGLVLYFWPFLLGGILSFLIILKIKSVKLQWSLIVPIVAVTLFFGSAWFSALISPTKIKNDSVAVSTPSQTPIQPTQTPQATIKPTPTPSQTSVPTLTPTPTAAPAKTPKSNIENNDLRKLFNEIDNANPDDIIFSVETNSGHIQAHRDDESENRWIVIEIMNRWPEIMVEFSLKSIARDFIYQVYHSGYKIKQAGITINGGSGKYYRVFLGTNQAKTLTEEDWKYLLPSNFYNWIKEVETSRNEEDRANATFLEENIK